MGCRQHAACEFGVEPHNSRRRFSPDSPDGSRRILPRTSDFLAESATYANRQTTVRVGAAGESKTNPRPAVQVSEFPWRTVPKGHPDSNPSGESGMNGPRGMIWPLFHASRHGTGLLRLTG